MTKTILVVDDEPKIVKVLKGYLEQAAFRVVTAGDGQLALTTFRHEKPDLVVLDLIVARHRRARRVSDSSPRV